MQVVTADALTDLPKINNFTVAESAQYDGEVPKSAYQAVLRRKPSSAEASLDQRASFADAKMEVTHRCYQQRVEKLFTCGAEFMVGCCYSRIADLMPVGLWLLWLMGTTSLQGQVVDANHHRTLFHHAQA